MIQVMESPLVPRAYMYTLATWKVTLVQIQMGNQKLQEKAITTYPTHGRLPMRSCKLQLASTNGLGLLPAAKFTHVHGDGL